MRHRGGGQAEVPVEGRAMTGRGEQSIALDAIAAVSSNEDL